MMLTVIVPTYNRLNYLEMALASLLRHGEIDILVVDDGSTNKSADHGAGQPFAKY
jgi:glycosyltransferase involved in cell wall biosynthesis